MLHEMKSTRAIPVKGEPASLIEDDEEPVTVNKVAIGENEKSQFCGQT